MLKANGQTHVNNNKKQNKPKKKQPAKRTDRGGNFGDSVVFRRPVYTCRGAACGCAARADGEAKPDCPAAYVLLNSSRELSTYLSTNLQTNLLLTYLSINLLIGRRARTAPTRSTTASPSAGGGTSSSGPATGTATPRPVVEPVQQSQPKRELQPLPEVPIFSQSFELLDGKFPIFWKGSGSRFGCERCPRVSARQHQTRPWVVFSPCESVSSPACLNVPRVHTHPRNRPNAAEQNTTVRSVCAKGRATPATRRGRSIHVSPQQNSIYYP